MLSVLLTQPDYCGTLAAVRCLGRAGFDVWMSGASAQSPAMHSRYVKEKFVSPEPDVRLGAVDRVARRPGSEAPGHGAVPDER